MEKIYSYIINIFAFREANQNFKFRESQDSEGSSSVRKSDQKRWVLAWNTVAQSFCF